MSSIDCMWPTSFAVLEVTFRTAKEVAVAQVVSTHPRARQTRRRTTVPRTSGGARPARTALSCPEIAGVARSPRARLDQDGGRPRSVNRGRRAEAHSPELVGDGPQGRQRADEEILGGPAQSQ